MPNALFRNKFSARGCGNRGLRTAPLTLLKQEAT